MRPILSALSCLLLLAAAHAQAQAQDISSVVRAGEHANFTRVVLSLPDDTQWRLVENDRNVDLLVTDRQVTFDLSQAFTRIPRTRLRNVTALPSGIRLELACPCPVRQVDGIAGQVVLDILSPTARPDPTPPPRPLARPQDLPAQRAGKALARMLRGLPPVQDSQETHLLDKVFPQAQNTPEPVPLAQDMAQTDTYAALLGTTLAQTIARAVSEDLLSPNRQFRAPTEGPAPALAGSALPHILTLNPDRQGFPMATQSCTSAISKHLPDWSTPPDIRSTAADWSGVFDALDQLDMARAQVKLHDLLRLGFGAEARQLLSLMPEAPGQAVLHQLSYVVDQDPAPEPDLLMQFATCSDMDALWAFLAAPAPSPMPDGTDHRVIRAMQSLSGPLRTHLGPAVVHQMLRHGAEDMAKLVQAGLDRASGTIGRTLEPDLLLGLEPERLATLDGADLLGLSDDDVVLILESAQARGLAVSQGLLDLAMDRQFAHRRSDMGRKLAEFSAAALAEAGHFGAAFDMALGPEAGLSPATQQRVVEALFARLVTTAGDTDFVVQMFDQAPWNKDDLSAELRMALGERLEGLGFGPEARKLRQPAALPRIDTPEAAIPAPMDAEQPRPPVQTPLADRPPTAQTSGPRVQLADAGARAPAPRLAMAGSDAAPDLSVGAALGPDILPPSPDLRPGGPLSQGRAAIENSAALRNQVLDLLSPDTAGTVQ